MSYIPASRVRLAIPALPLLVGLAIGSWLATSTLSWGSAFIIWQLLLWSIVSVIIALITSRVAQVIPPAIPSNSSDKDLDRLYKITVSSYAGGAIALLAGLGTSIWAMVVDGVTTTPVEVYWPLPIAAFLLVAPGPAQSKINEIDDQRARAARERERAYRESQRRKRCSELSSQQKSRYDASFLMTLYSLVQDDKTKRTTTLSQVTSKLNHECTPELLPVTLRTWEDKKFIEVTEKSSSDHDYHVTLSEVGYYTCGRALEVGIEQALKQHESCLRLSDQDKAAYQKQLFIDIAKLAFGTTQRDVRPQKRSVALDKVRSTQKHRCWPELIDAALAALTQLGLIEVTSPRPRDYRSEGLGFLFGNYQPDRGQPDRRQPEVVLTAKGEAVNTEMGPSDSLEIAINRYEEQLRIERERQKRCRETTGPQRKEFEEQFLRVLYTVAAGDVREVMLRDIWSHLNHECTRELTGHALRVWRELKCINISSTYLHKYGENESDVQISINEHTMLSLTTLGRDLCELSFELKSMQQARRRLLEGFGTRVNIMGDIFENISGNTTIINRSNLVNAMNATEGTVGPDVSEALRQLAEFIQQSGNNEAAEIFNAFAEELQHSNPRKSLLKSLWNGMLASLPTIAELATVTGTIAALIR